MSDKNCIAFLQWALPRLHLRWAGFRKVRRQVCRRLSARLRALGLADLTAYRAYLLAHEAEWQALDGLCRVTISRFHRDRGVWDTLRAEWLPGLAARAEAAGRPTLRVWSAGCASGEEAYTTALIWRLEVSPRFPALGLEVVGTDVDAHLLRRARAALYPAGCLRELPAGWREAAFAQEEDGWVLRAPFRAGVRFCRMDLRRRRPKGPFDLILCRNLAFTYFDATLQGETAARLASRLYPGGLLLLGRHERLPADAAGIRAGLAAELSALRPPQTDAWRRIPERERG